MRRPRQSAKVAQLEVQRAADGEAGGGLPFNVTNMWALAEGTVALEDFSERALEQMNEMSVAAEISKRRRALKVELGFGPDALCIEDPPAPGCTCLEQYVAEEIPE